MNVMDAAHAVAHEYGVEAMSVRLGVRYKVFNSQVNPNDPTHTLGLVNSVRMQQIAGRCDILYAMAEALDHVCILKPTIDNESINEATAAACVEFGQFIQEVTETLRDNRVTRNEAKRMQKELTELIAAATRLHAMVAAKAESRRGA